MRQTDIDFLKRNGWIDYSDEHLAFIGDTAHLSALLALGEQKTAFVLCIICIQGRLQVAVDNTVQHLAAHQALVCPIHSLLTDCLCSPDLRAIAICASPSVFKELYLNHQMWEYYQFTLRNHVIDFTDGDWHRFSLYNDLLAANLEEGGEGNRFHRQIVRSLWQSIIYEFMAVVDRRVIHVKPLPEQAIGMELLSSRFMELLAQSEGRIHTVAEFADRLFVTPKYLSTSVKQTTGKTALKWIHETVAKEVERLLAHSDRNIKEIAFQLNFPNASFFGKFVKAHLGDTPAKIQGRNRRVER